MIDAGAHIELTENELRNICNGEIPAPAPNQVPSDIEVIPATSENYQDNKEMLEIETFEAKRAAFARKNGVLQPDGNRSKR